MITARQVYEHCLIETNKVEAPSLLIEDFNYLVNKSIYLHFNKGYNIYDVNQLTTDDLRVLKTSIRLPVLFVSGGSNYERYHKVELPDDYFHILNCICVFTSTDDLGCVKANDEVSFGAKRLTSDMWSQIINNWYMRPMYSRPYYFIHNRRSDQNVPFIPKEANDTKHGNFSKVTVEIRYGQDSDGINKNFDLTSVTIDYLKTPLTITLTQEQIDLVEDTSQPLEFPDYVCYEIINELGKLMLENASDPRLQTYIPVNLSIANPTQATQSK